MEQRKNEKKDRKPRAFGWIFAGVLLLTILAAAGLFLLWAWVSYHMRFSAELIRMGLLGLYILPCLFGGKMLTRTRCGNTLLWGAGLGGAFCGVLLLASLAWTMFTGGGTPEWDWTDVLPVLLSVPGGMAGAIKRGKTLSNA